MPLTKCLNNRPKIFAVIYWEKPDNKHSTAKIKEKIDTNHLLITLQFRSQQTKQQWMRDGCG